MNPVKTLLLAALTCSIHAHASQFIPVQFEGNANLQTQLPAAGATFPKGYTTLATIPFQLNPTGNNFWCGAIGTEPNPHILSVPVAIDSVKTVYALMNLYWGKPHDSTIAAIEFVGSPCALYRVPLVANVNIRDFDTIPPSFADSIDTAFAKEVFNNHQGQRLDCLKFELPPEFFGQKLTEIRVIDSGETDVQRVFVYGITVETSPLPIPQTLEPIPFACNGRLQTDLTGSTGKNYPCGELTLKGIPFSIPATGNNWWHASNAGTENPRILTIPVNRYGVSEIYTLINLYWGVHGDSTMAAIEFAGDKDTFTVALYTGRHLRDFDYNGTVYENEIDTEITTEVYKNGNGQRLDRQRLVLPSEFLTDTLRSIRIIDNGAEKVQRLFLYGITVKHTQDMSTHAYVKKPARTAPTVLHKQLASERSTYILNGRKVPAAAHTLAAPKQVIIQQKRLKTIW